MSGQNTDLIKEKLDIAEFVRQYVQLVPAGKNLKGLCPFHKEKSGSFIVSPDRQIWHCFGCGLGGDIFGFLMRYENIEFIEALKVLAERAGVDLKIAGTADQKQYTVLYEINRWAKNYFVAALAAEGAKPIQEYLSGRGLSKQTIETFEIGFAPAGNDNLMRFLTKKGFSVSDIEHAGLAYKTDRGTYWDRFRNRVMFPLHNAFGKVIGFTGRVLPGNESENVGKYVNSPETPIFNKSKLLFGFWQTKNAIRDTKTAVLVEGQMDFLMSFQDGIANAVATSGTALTPDHLKVLRRLAENLVLSFDNDGAGRAAAERTIDLAQQYDFNVRVVSLGGEGAKDPADIVKATPGKMGELVKAAVPAMEYYFEYYGVSKQQAIAEKKKAVRSALSKIKTISSAVEQSHWLSELASKTGFSDQVLMAEMAQVKTEGSLGARNVEEATGAFMPAVVGRHEAILERLLSLALLDKSLQKEINEQLEIAPEIYKEALGSIAVGAKSVPAGPLGELLNLVYMRSSLEPSDPEKIKEEFKSLVAALSGEQTKDKRKVLQEAIKAAEKAKDEVKLAALLKEYRDLTKK